MPERVISISRVVKAPPEAIFAVLADPGRHGEIDGSDTVQKLRGDATRLTLGAKFGMDMRLGPLPYRINNTVVEFEDNRLIAWAHLGKHRWRFRLESVAGANPPSTNVTEEFDWSTARSPRFIEMMGYPERHVGNIERTLERLAALVES